MGETNINIAMSPFEQFTRDDVRDLISEFPLAWLVARGESKASLLPLLGEYDDAGELVSLLGHLARRNPLVALLSDAPAATILINGPHGYVSPDQAERRDWGPTWNYAQLTIAADMRFLDGEIDTALDALIRAMEGDRWTSAQLGPRYAGMARAVIPFRAHVTGVSGRFKLGQDEDRDTLAAILRNHHDPTLTRWMRRFDR
jgi:transcriptional regulator